jgi:hypothetical protein
VTKVKTKGKQPLAETVKPEDIIISEEEQSPPNFIFSKAPNYGISGKYGDYALVECKIAHRTGKKEDGENEGKVIRYRKWEDINYSSTFHGVFENLVCHLSLNKIKSKVKVTDMAEIKQIYLDIKDVIMKSLKDESVTTNQTKEICDLHDVKQKLENDIRELTQEKTKIIKIQEDIDKIYSEIKATRTLVMNKPKKHRMKLED